MKIAWFYRCGYFCGYFRLIEVTNTNLVKSVCGADEKKRQFIHTHASKRATPTDTSSLRTIAHVFCTSFFCFSVRPSFSSNLLSFRKKSNRPRNSAMFASACGNRAWSMENNCTVDQMIIPQMIFTMGDLTSR